MLSNNDFEAIFSDPFLTYNKDQWECQDPKMEVLYHIRPKFLGIFPYIGLKNRPYVWSMYLQSIGSWNEWPLKRSKFFSWGWAKVNIKIAGKWMFIP